MLRWSFVLPLALVVVAGLLSGADVARPSTGDPMIPHSAQARGVKVMWGRSSAFEPRPQPGLRTRFTRNAVILEKRGEYYREVVRPTNVRVACEVVYSRGSRNVVRRMQVAGAWQSDVDEYGGDGQVRCGPWTVLKDSLGLVLQVSPRLVYRGTSYRGPGLSTRIKRSSSSDQPESTVPVSFLPRVEAGSIYPKLAQIPFSSPVSALWQAFGKPPSSTCSATEGSLTCDWSTAVDAVHVEGGLNESFGGVQGGAIRFTRALFTTKDLSRSRLRGWTTPDGIHLGSTAAEVKRIDDPLLCDGRQCTIEPRQRLHPVGDTRYRFFVTFTFDGRPSNPGSRVIQIDVRQTNREEGACDVGLVYLTASSFGFEATCSGKLKAARLEPYNGSTRIRSYDYPPDNTWLLYADDGSKAREINQERSVVTPRFTADAHHWKIACPEPVVGGNIPFWCPPDRNDRGGGLTWAADVFEEWHLTMRATSSVPANLNADPRKIAPLRFVAEFVGRQPFVIIIRRTS